MYSIAMKSLAIVSIICALGCDGAREITFPTLPPGTAPVAGPPAIIGANSAYMQAGIVSTNAWEPPVVTVHDRAGIAVQGATITCAVETGGGKIEHSTALTNPYGRAACGDWMLGATAGENTLRVGVDNVSPITFAVTVHDSAYYEIYDLMSVNGAALPFSFGWIVLLGGKYLLAPDSSFIQIGFWSEGTSVWNGRYDRAANIVTFFGPFPYGIGELAGNLLTVSYFDSDSALEVYRKVN